MADRERQCHLGDVCGEPYPIVLPPLYLPRRHKPDWVQRVVRGVVYATAGLIFVFLVCAWLAVSFFLRPFVYGFEVPTDPYEATVYRDCYADALKYCKRTFLSDRMVIIACMLENKERLRLKCARHLYDTPRGNGNAP